MRTLKLPVQALKLPMQIIELSVQIIRLSLPVIKSPVQILSLPIQIQKKLHTTLALRLAGTDGPKCEVSGVKYTLTSSDQGQGNRLKLSQRPHGPH